MLKKSDLKKFNSLMQEANSFKNDKNYNKAIEKYFEAIEFVENKVKESGSKQVEINNIKSQIDQLYSVEIIDIVKDFEDELQNENFENAEKLLEEVIRIADKIENETLRTHELDEVNFLKEKLKLGKEIHEAKLLIDKNDFDNALSFLKDLLERANSLHDDPQNKQILTIKNLIDGILANKVKILIEKAQRIKEQENLDDKLELYNEVLKVIENFNDPKLKSDEKEKIMNLINQAYANVIDSIVISSENLFNKEQIEDAEEQLKNALNLASRMPESEVKHLKISNIKDIGSKLINPKYVEKIEPLIEKGKELISKEFFENDIIVVNNAIKYFSQALDLINKMIDSDEKETYFEKVSELINNTCLARINLLKDNILAKLGGKEYDSAINILYEAIGIAKKMPISEDENKYLNELKDSVNDVYISQINEILNEAESLVKKNEFELAIEKYNDALKITDRMYLTEKMENVVEKIKSLIYQAELKNLVKQGDLAAEEEKYEKELEKLSKRMEYARTIDDSKRRNEEMEKIKESIDQLHFSRIELLLEQSEKFFENKNFEKSFECFESAIKINENIESPKFKNRIPIKSRYKVKLVEKAKIDINERNFDQAINTCQKALELDEEYQDAHFYMALSRFKKGELDLALRDFEKTIKLNENNALSWNYIGIISERKGLLDQALDAFNRAIKLEPNNAEFNYNLGFTLMNNGDIDKAIESLMKSVELDPSLAKGWLFLGRAYMIKQDVSKAIHHIEKAVNLDDNLKEIFSEKIDNYRNIIETINDALNSEFKKNL